MYVDPTGLQSKSLLKWRTLPPMPNSSSAPNDPTQAMVLDAPSIEQLYGDIDLGDLPFPVSPTVGAPSIFGGLRLQMWIRELLNGDDTETQAGPHNPNTHSDPRAQGPHAHVPEVTNDDGTPWLPIY